MHYFVSFLVCNHLELEERAGCFAFNVPWLFLTVSWVGLQFVIMVVHLPTFLLFPCLSSDFCYLLTIFANRFGAISGPTECRSCSGSNTLIGFLKESFVKIDLKKKLVDDINSIVYIPFVIVVLNACKVWKTAKISTILRWCGTHVKR